MCRRPLQTKPERSSESALPSHALEAAQAIPRYGDGGVDEPFVRLLGALDEMPADG